MGAKVKNCGLFFGALITPVSQRLRNIDASRQFGFSLIELMFVVGILGILATMGQREYVRSKVKAQQMEAKVMLAHAAKFFIQDTEDNGSVGAGYVVCTATGACSPEMLSRLTGAGLVQTSPGFWTNNAGASSRYRFRIGDCGPYGYCMYAYALNPGLLRPGCVSDSWFIPENSTTIIKSTSCAD